MPKCWRGGLSGGGGPHGGAALCGHGAGVDGRTRIHGGSWRGAWRAGCALARRRAQSIRHNRGGCPSPLSPLLPERHTMSLPAKVKIGLVQRLQDAGLKNIEVTSYVSPQWVPQMADNHQVMAGIARQQGVVYSVLTPNLKGFAAALPDRPDEIVVFGSASEAFSQKNINCSIAQSIERFAPVVQAAR